MADNDQFDALEAKITSLREEVDTQRATIRDLINSDASLRLTIKEQQQSIKEQQLSIDRLVLQNKDLSTLVSVQSGVISRQRDEIDTLKAQNGRLVSEMENQAKRLALLENRSRDLRGKLYATHSEKKSIVMQGLVQFFAAGFVNIVVYDTDLGKENNSWLVVVASYAVLVTFVQKYIDVNYLEKAIMMEQSSIKTSTDNLLKED